MLSPPAARLDCHAQPRVSARPSRRVVRRSALLVGVASALIAVGLASTARIGQAASRTPSPAGALPGRLPNDPALKRVILMADVRRRQRAYPSPVAFEAALAGVWLPDALAAGNTALWRESFGFGLADVGRVAAAGFHPRPVMDADGRFDRTLVRSRLGARGYGTEAELMRHGAGGSIDLGTAAGRLALRALDRVAVSPARLIAASTTALATSALSPQSTLAAGGASPRVDSAGLTAGLPCFTHPRGPASRLHATVGRPIIGW